MGNYAILPKDYVNTESGEDYHIFKIKSKNDNPDGTINIVIEKYSECRLESIKFNFDNLSLYNFVVKYNNKDYRYNFYYKNKDDIYYFDNDRNARVTISVFIKEKTCGTCVSTLY